MYVLRISLALLLTCTVNAKPMPTQSTLTPKVVEKTAPTTKQVPSKPTFVLPKLPYAYNALEPHIDAKTMEIHYTKHHQGYVDNLNKALEPYPNLHTKTLVQLLTSLDQLPQEIRVAVKNNAGGHYNHSFFWQCMTAAKDSKFDAKGKLAQAINASFGSFDEFKRLFIEAAKTRFGSGWAWLCINPHGALRIVSSKDQDCPISQDYIPLLCLDVWEHAYYLKYQNKRPDYITAWWNVVNWNYVEGVYAKFADIAKAASDKAAATKATTTPTAATAKTTTPAKAPAKATATAATPAKAATTAQAPAKK